MPYPAPNAVTSTCLLQVTIVYSVTLENRTMATSSRFGSKIYAFAKRTTRFFPSHFQSVQCIGLRFSFLQTQSITGTCSDQPGSTVFIEVLFYVSTSISKACASNVVRSSDPLKVTTPLLPLLQLKYLKSRIGVKHVLPVLFV